MNPLLTIAQVATALSVSERTVYRLIADGKLVTVKIADNTTRVRESDLDEFLDRQVSGV